MGLLIGAVIVLSIALIYLELVVGRVSDKDQLKRDRSRFYG